jgi:hypothetical protein
VNERVIDVNLLIVIDDNHVFFGPRPWLKFEHTILCIEWKVAYIDRAIAAQNVREYPRYVAVICSTQKKTVALI